jgi:hypothetical protein
MRRTHLQVVAAATTMIIVCFHWRWRLAVGCSAARRRAGIADVNTVNELMARSAKLHSQSCESASCPQNLSCVCPEPVLANDRI